MIVDRYSKYTYFILYKESYIVEDLAYIFLQIMANVYGLSEEIISNRGAIFASKFWTSLNKEMGVKTRFNITFHVQTNRPAERTNQTLEQSLRCFISEKQDD